jgi:hypothetical protein
MVETPMGVPSTERARVTLPISKVMTVGLGRRTVPLALVPSGRVVVRMLKDVTVKPARPLKPGFRLDLVR